jgi:hypothetical protein
MRAPHGRIVAWYCANPACGEYQQPVMVRESYSAGRWWPLDAFDCHECGRPLADDVEPVRGDR